MACKPFEPSDKTITSWRTFCVTNNKYTQYVREDGEVKINFQVTASSWEDGLQKLTSHNNHNQTSSQSTSQPTSSQSNHKRSTSLQSNNNDKTETDVGSDPPPMNATTKRKRKRKKKKKQKKKKRTPKKAVKRKKKSTQKKSVKRKKKTAKKKKGPKRAFVSDENKREIVRKIGNQIKMRGRDKVNVQQELRKHKNIYKGKNTNIYNWLKNGVESNKWKCGRKSKTGDVEQQLVKVLIVSKNKGVHLSNALITTNALAIHDTLNLSFTCKYASGWIYRFKSRCRKGIYGVDAKKLFFVSN